MLTKTKNIDRRGFGKSIAHGQIQCHLKKEIACLELEKNLGSRLVSRRADAVWEEKKIVFEIQLSPISLKEVLARCSDYASLGYQVVWILHEGVFNGRKLSPAEKYLRVSCPTYFTNGGAIYDQIEVISGRRRLYQGAPFLVEIAFPCIPFIKVPNRAWPLHFVGDIHTFCATQGAKEIDEIIRTYGPPQGWRWWIQFIGFRILELVSTSQK